VNNDADNHGYKYDVYASRTVKSHSTTTLRQRRESVLIRKDLDLDGNFDREVIFDSVISTVHVTSFTEETTNIHWKCMGLTGLKRTPEKDEFGSMTEYRKS